MSDTSQLASRVLGRGGVGQFKLPISLNYLAQGEWQGGGFCPNPPPFLPRSSKPEIIILVGEL